MQHTAAAAPALPGGAGLTVVVNPAAGAGGRDLGQDLRKLLPAAHLVPAAGGEVEQALRDAADSCIALGVGGDGTTNAAAAIALERDLPLVVLPGGTLNHFAAELGVTDVASVAQAVQTGSAVRITVGSAAVNGDGQLFLNTLALGVYPDLVREREHRQHRIGKWPTMAWATVRVLRRANPVRLEVDGQNRLLWTLFAGNGRYHPSGFAPTWRERLDDGTIDVRLIDATRPLARTRLLLAVLTGRLGRSRAYEQRVVAETHLRPLQQGLTLARDGEVNDAPDRLHLHAASRPLTVYRPPPSRA